MTIKVVSLNTLHGGRLFEPMVDFLRAQNADIVMLQEVLRLDKPGLPPRFNTVAELQKRLGYTYAEFSPLFTWIVEEGDPQMGNAVLSNFPLRARETTFFNEPYNDHYVSSPDTYHLIPRALQHVEVEALAGVVNVFNVHGVWDLDGDNPSERRMHMARVIIEKTKGKEHVVVAGDTNSKPTNKAMLLIEQHLDSVFHNDLKTSFNVRQKDLKKFPGYATATVDLMYVSHDITVIDRACPNVDISDHLPLTVTLRIG